MSGIATDANVLAQQRAFLAGAAAAVEPAWLALRRADAMQRFVALGLPGRRDEAWRFTNLRPLTGGNGLPLPGSDAARDPAGLAGHRLPGVAHRIVLLNGRLAPELSQIGKLPQGVWLGSVSDCLESRPDLAETLFDSGDLQGAQPFASLNAAFFADGFVLALDPGVELQHPVEVLHIGAAPDRCAWHVRNAILAGAGSRAQVVETWTASGAGWANAVTSIELGVAAALRHVTVQAAEPTAMHLALVRARLDRAADYDSFTLICGARLSRQDIQVCVAGEAASFALNGLYLLRGDQEATISVLADHQASGGQTRELVKGVLTDRAHGVFLGTVAVREGADATDARQLNRTMLLSRQARVDSKPELTIHADEVKCSHGATVGDIDEAALFYLLSRGIPPTTAKQMLIAAFAADVFDEAALPHDTDAHVRRYLERWLESGA